ncbi:MAG TPA: alpha/beta hydrolase [Ilumatobacter sp.]|nr:alpha/beta hydrolase [Ilumatobacter sp.]
MKRLAGAGLQLAADVYGNPGDPAVILLHGGGQTRHSWGKAAAAFADAGYYAASVDLRGHGDSDWTPDGEYGMDQFASDVRALADQFRTPYGPPALVGASLGGLSILVAVGESAPERQAELARCVVLVDIAPRVEIHGRDRIRAFMVGGLRGFDTIEQAADSVSEFIPHRPRPNDLSGLRKNLRQRGDGRWYWHWDPRWMSNQTGVDGQPGIVAHERLRAAAAGLRVPTLLVRGGISDIVSEESVRELRDLVPGVQVVDIASAGHMVAGDRNDVFNDAVIAFVRQAADR